MLSIRPLSEELQKIAIEELNEDPDTICDTVNEIRDWTEVQEHLRVKTDDQTLVTLLRGCKYDLEMAKQKIESMCSMRTEMTEFYSNRDPFHPDIQELLSKGFSLPLLKTKTPGSPRVILNRPSTVDPSRISAESCIKYLLMIGDILLNEDDQFNVAGSQTIGDFKRTTVHHRKLASLSLAKKVYKLYNDAYAVIPKGSYTINVPKFAEMLYNMFKFLMLPEHRSLVHIYSEGSPAELFEAIPLSILPKEYGGSGGTVEELTVHWKEKVESYRDWFLEEEQYRLVETSLPEEKNSSMFQMGWLWDKMSFE